MLDPGHLDRRFDTLASAAHWYVGFSGGVDSMALLHLAWCWGRGRAGAPPLTALHINHGLQDAAGDWQAHCRAVCDSLDVPLLARRVAVAGSGEAAAREARYGAFRELLGEGEVLLLAHHLDDQVETFFLRLLRGAGVEGLAAMPAQRPLGRGMLARPLLDVPRAALEHYAREQSLDWVEDPSNADTSLDRNFLRVEILPLLAARWPACRRTIARAATHMAGAMAALEEATGTPATVYSVTGDPGLPLEALVAPGVENAARNLRGWLNLQGCQPPDSAALKEFLRQLRSAGEDGAPQLCTADWTLCRFRDAVYLQPSFTAAPPGSPLDIAPGERHRVPGVGSLALVADSAGAGVATGAPLRIDWRRGGERCRVRGRDGSASLKKLLQELAVPPWWRDRVPLLYRGADLLAIGDLLVCDDAPEARAEAADQARYALLWDRFDSALD